MAGSASRTRRSRTPQKGRKPKHRPSGWLSPLAQHVARLLRKRRPRRTSRPSPPKAPDARTRWQATPRGGRDAPGRLPRAKAQAKKDERAIIRLGRWYVAMLHSSHLSLSFLVVFCLVSELWPSTSLPRPLLSPPPLQYNTALEHLSKRETLILPGRKASE